MLTPAPKGPVPALVLAVPALVLAVPALLLAVPGRGRPAGSFDSNCVERGRVEVVEGSDKVAPGLVEVFNHDEPAVDIRVFQRTGAEVTMKLDLRRPHRGTGIGRGRR